MSEDADRIKRLIEFKKKLEAEIEKMSSDLKDSQAALETINSILIEKGFKRLAVTGVSTSTGPMAPGERVEEGKPVSTPQWPQESEAEEPLRSTTGELLATLHIGEDSLRMIPAEDKSFDINTPPFMHFFVERVLLKMQERDGALVKAGQLSPERILCYNIVRDGNIIREIVINNSDSERVRELRSSIRWTLEKMYEKMKSQG